MNHLNDSINALRDFIDHLDNDKGVDVAPARAALLDLQEALYCNQPLTAAVEGFCSEVEQVAAAKERPRGGQHVPCHSQLMNTGPSAMCALERYARDFRESLERKPDICRCPTNHHLATCPLEP